MQNASDLPQILLDSNYHSVCSHSDLPQCSWLSCQIQSYRIMDHNPSTRIKNRVTNSIQEP